MPTEQRVVREPVAIGRFYPQNKDQLQAVVPAYLAQAKVPAPAKNPWAYVLPHAGYVYCGAVLGAALAHAHLPETLFVLCPNHTGRGAPLSVWPNGVWRMPLGDFPVDETLATRLTQGSAFTKDYIAHLGEHSIEVLLPFLYYACGQKLPLLVPICVGTHDKNVLRRAAAELIDLLGALAKEGRQAGLIVSSDMNHYESHEDCLRKDDMALARIAAHDPDGLLDVCQAEHITMCGVGPCALVLYAAKHVGTLTSSVVAHTTSAEASGNYRQTVGYAGIHLTFC